MPSYRQLFPYEHAKSDSSLLLSNRFYSHSKPEKAVFLDRDGVINHDFGYTSKPENFSIIDGVFAACRWFSEQGFQLVVVTNQSGIARGYYSETEFASLTSWMLKAFANEGITLAGVYYCPHHPTAGVGEYLQHCDCRKPNAGMLLQAATTVL